MYKAVLASLFIISLLQGCASPKVPVRMLMPAKYSEPTNYKRVAVLPFKGPHGEEVAGKLEARLVKIRVKEEGKPWFDVYERERLKEALRELRLGRSGLVDPASAAKIGRFIGVQGIYMGRINEYDVDYNHYKATRSYCAEKNKKGKCLDWREKTVYCKRRQVVFEFTPKLVDVENARVVYSSPYRQAITHRACDGGFADSDEYVMRNAIYHALSDFAKDVAPHFEAQFIAIKDSADDLRGEAETYFKSGVEFAKNERLERGCRFWERARDAGGKSMPLLYNLGVCAEYHGDFETAHEWYYQADEMLMKPDKEVSGALKRIQHKMDARRKLGNQLRQSR